MNAIVYTSHAGHTRQYAELLGQKLNLPVYDLETAGKNLAPASEIIYLGWLMAGSVQGCKKAVKSYNVKAVCAVGMTEDDAQLGEIRPKNGLPADMPVFYLQGGFEMDKLRGIYRFMMGTIKSSSEKKLAKKTDRSKADDELLEMMGNGKNAVNAESLGKVTEWYSKAVGRDDQ